MVIILTGGGSGGHITPILAVADKLKEIKPDVELVYIGQTGDHLADIPSTHPNIDEVFSVRAGKFRRYHGEGIKQLLDLKTMLKNIRDFFLFIIGIWQSYKLLRRLKPAAIYTPGGFVGVPVGIAARLRHVPFVTHDLDAVPGLANKINSRWAAAHAVAMPKELYAYPAEKTYVVGVPVSTEYQPVTEALQREYRKGFGIPEDARVICITGGGLGSSKLNSAVLGAALGLFKKYSNLYIFHITGRKHEVEILGRYQEMTEIPKDRVIIKGFVRDLYRYSAAADVIVCRAGATNLAEFAVQGRPLIIVPNPALTGGHQLKNASVLESAHAALVVPEENIEENGYGLLETLSKVLDSRDLRIMLASKLQTFANPDSATELARVILQTAKH